MVVGQAISCAAEAVVFIVLRRDPMQSNPQIAAPAVGEFRGEALDWKLWEAGMQEGDIVHVSEPLPAHWHLCEDANNQVQDSRLL